jgi:WD40 repeat protein
MTAAPAAGTASSFAFPAVVSAAVWAGPAAVFALGDGTAASCRPDGDRFQLERLIPAHAGAILCAALHPDGRSLLTGGDDGRLLRIAVDGTTTVLAETGGRWVHDVAASAASGVIVCAVGAEALVVRPDRPGVSHRFAHPSSIGGLALNGRGRRLAVAHYGGVSLWWALAAGGQPERLAWRGSHLNLTWSPDSRYVISAMQENSLHGWRLGDSDHLRMTGYPAKCRSLSWTAKGRYLLTSGAGIVVGWPFLGRSGPKDRAPVELGPPGTTVTRVAAHPVQELCAAGYADGTVRLLRLGDGADIQVRDGSGSPVTALVWSADGGALAWGTEGGEAGVFHPAGSSRTG